MGFRASTHGRKYNRCWKTMIWEDWMILTWIMKMPKVPIYDSIKDCLHIQELMQPELMQQNA